MFSRSFGTLSHHRPPGVANLHYMHQMSILKVFYISGGVGGCGIISAFRVTGARVGTIGTDTSMYKRTHSLQITEGGAFGILNIFTIKYHPLNNFPPFQPSRPGGL